MLKGIGGIAVLGLSGCLTKESSNGTPTASEGISLSFEESSLPDALEETGQSNAQLPTITGRHAAEGSQSLLLSSSPGTESKAQVTTSSAMTPPVATSVSIQPVSDGGPENAVAVTLQNEDRSAGVQLLLSDYYGASRIEVWEGVASEKTTEAEFGALLEEDAWNDVSLAVSGDVAEASVDGTEATAALPESLFDSVVYAAVSANAWGNGHPIQITVDSLDVTPSSN